MAKEIAISKRLKISEAQKYMIFAAVGASLILGVSLALIVYFTKKISFNAKVIAAEDQSIVAYSNIIRDTGICEKPNGEVYSNDELKKCDPDSIEISQIPDTLRANILEKIASNSALNSVPKEASSSCVNPSTGKNYTYAELNKIYKDANGSTELTAASQLIKSCSALRIIPDALPSFKNEEALLASLNKLFIDAGWQPESLSPSGTASASDLSSGLNAISVRLSVEANTGTTMKVLNNVERSIREFNIERATIEWGSNDTLSLSAQATAYYIDPVKITETTKTITAEDN